MLKAKLKLTSTRKKQIWENLKKRYTQERRVLKHKVAMVGVQNIRREIDKRKLVKTSDMKQKIDYKLVNDGIEFISSTEYSVYLNRGIRKHVMRYLQKAVRPIPIEIDKNEVIFRWATEESMRKGKWKHPGFNRGKGFFQVGIETTKTMMMKELNEITRKTLLRK